MMTSIVKAAFAVSVPLGFLVLGATIALNRGMAHVEKRIDNAVHAESQAASVAAPESIKADPIDYNRDHRGGVLPEPKGGIKTLKEQRVGDQRVGSQSRDVSIIQPAVHYKHLDPHTGRWAELQPARVYQLTDADFPEERKASAAPRSDKQPKVSQVSYQGSKLEPKAGQPVRNVARAAGRPIKRALGFIFRGRRCR